MNYAERRRRLMEALPDGPILLLASPEATRNNDTHHPYRPSSDVLWLSGFEEPDAVLLLLPNHDEHRFVMFVRPRDRDREVWDGYRAGPEGAVERFGADAAFPISELDERLPGYLANQETVHHALGVDEAFDKRLLRMIAGLRNTRRQPDRAPRSITDPRRVLHDMRRIKSAPELATMRDAARISAEAHLLGMMRTRPGMYEYQLRGIIEAAFLERGAHWPAYGSIVASGPNACVLHYVSNDRRMNDGDLVLVDAGAEFRFYAGDITRCWPVGRAFSGPQREVYEAVLDVQKRAIEDAVVGTTWNELHDRTIRRTTEHLVALGLLHGDVDTLIGEGAFRRFFMHGTGHYLGMDVHDVGTYLLSAEVGVPFDPGVVITVEPGIYIAPDDTTVPERFRGIGVRIEDDVILTAHGPEILTGDVPKEIADIEALRREA